MADFSGGDGGRKWVIKCDGKNYTSYDTREQAEKYVAMQKGKLKGGKAAGKTVDLCYAAKCSWEIVERGEK